MSDWVVRLIEQSGYLGVGFLMFLETIFPPIPSEVIMPVAGVAAGQGKLHYGWVVAAGTCGAMLGNVFAVPGGLLDFAARFRQWLAHLQRDHARQPLAVLAQLRGHIPQQRCPFGQRSPAPFPRRARRRGQRGFDARRVREWPGRKVLAGGRIDGRAGILADGLLHALLC